jgi:hypothetical protein
MRTPIFFIAYSFSTLNLKYNRLLTGIIAVRGFRGICGKRESVLKNYKCDLSNLSVFGFQIFWFHYYFDLVQYFAVCDLHGVGEIRESYLHVFQRYLCDISNHVFYALHLPLLMVMVFFSIHFILMVRGVREIRESYNLFKGTYVTYQIMVFFLLLSLVVKIFFQFISIHLSILSKEKTNEPNDKENNVEDMFLVCFSFSFCLISKFA